MKLYAFACARYWTFRRGRHLFRKDTTGSGGCQGLRGGNMLRLLAFFIRLVAFLGSLVLFFYVLVRMSLDRIFLFFCCFLSL